MATNADFNALIVRIDEATTTLENSVDAVANGASDVEDSVVLAQQAATTATQQASQAANSATAAATASANAQTQANRAQGIADNLLATAPFQEAPQDGLTYGRNNADWVVVDAGGAAVTSVNGEAPDASGNVELSIPTAVSELANDSGYITQAAVPTAVSALTNDAGYITAAQVPPSGVQEAPNDGQQYARQNAAWSPVQSPTAPFVGDEVGALGFSSTPALLTAWATAGAWFAQPLSELRGVSPSTGNGWDAYFSSPENLGKLPAGLYYYKSTDFKGANNPLTGRQGIIAVINYSSTKNIVNGVQVTKPPQCSGFTKTAISVSWSGSITTQSAAVHILSFNANSTTVQSWVAA